MAMSLKYPFKLFSFKYIVFKAKIVLIFFELLPSNQSCQDPIILSAWDWVNWAALVCVLIPRPARMDANDIVGLQSVPQMPYLPSPLTCTPEEST